MLSDANGLPLLVGVSAGNTHDSEGLKPMVEGHRTRHAPHRGRHFKPQRLHAYKAYDRADLREWSGGKRIGVRIARKGIESSERLGRRRWVIERTMLLAVRLPTSEPSLRARSPQPPDPFSDWQPPCVATSDSSVSPRRTRSEAGTVLGSPEGPGDGRGVGDGDGIGAHRLVHEDTAERFPRFRLSALRPVMIRGS